MSPVIVPFATAILSSTKKRFKLLDSNCNNFNSINSNIVGTKSSRELYGVQLEVGIPYF